MTPAPVTPSSPNLIVVLRRLRPRSWAASGTLLFGALAVLAGSLLAVLIGVAPSPVVVPLALVGLLVALATLVRIELGLVVLVFIMYTRLSDNLIKYAGAPSIADPFVIMLIGVIAVRWLLFQEQLTGWGTAAMLFGVYGLVGALGLFFAAAPDRVVTALNAYIRDVLIAMLIVTQLKRAAQLRMLVWTLLAAGIVMGTVTVYQQLTGTFANPYWGFGVAAIQNIVGQTNDYRIGGVVSDPNFYAQILVVLVPLALDRFWNERHWALRALALWALGVIVLSILFTFSRGGFLALVFVTGLSLIRHSLKPAFWLALGLVAILAFQLLPARYTDRILTLEEFFPSNPNQVITDSALLGRTSVILATWQIFIDHPVLGVGLGNHPVYLPAYSVSIGLSPTREERPVHNVILEVMADTGVLGLVTLVIVLGIVLRNVFQAQRRLVQADRPAEAALVAAIGIAVAGYFFGASFLPNAYPRYLWLIVGIALAMPGLVSQELSSERVSPA